jgi:type I restriction enzyme S subunit
MELNIKRDDWIIEKLGDFAISQKGKKPKNQSTIQTDIYKYPYVDIQAFEKKIFDSYTDGEKCNFCTEDDFLMVWDGSRSGLVGKAIDGAIGSTLVKINLPLIEDHFAYYFLKSKYLEINTKAKGTGTPHVNPDLLWNYNFPIVPILEQKAIVSKIEQLFSELDNGIENLKIAQNKLKIYRQAVLKKAFEGELTKEWREKQTDLPTANKLLEDIKKEREEHYLKQLEEWKERIKEWEDNGKDGTKPKKPRKSKEQDSLNSNEIKELSTLPKSWKWVKWEQILAYGSESFKRGPFGSALKKAFFVESGYKVYEQYCPINDDCSFERYYITPEKFEELKGFAVQAEDFLISCSGVTLGRITQVPAEYKEGVINQAILRVRLNNQYYSDALFKILFRSHYFQRKIFDNSTGSAIPNVKGVNELKAIPLPLFSIQEQTQIVQEVELRLSVCDNIEETIKASLQKSEALRQSILKKAFEGKLLTEKELEDIKNNPEYESAEKLLERIKQERDK